MIVEVPIQVDSVVVWLALNAGSRSEQPETSGVTHLLEHTIPQAPLAAFGDKSLTELVEGLGGLVNAVTSKEFFAIYFHVATADSPVALEWMMAAISLDDITRLPLEQERQAIAAELAEAAADPRDRCYDSVYETIFGNSGLGLPTGGSTHSVAKLRSSDLGAQLARARSGSRILFVSGGIDPRLFSQHEVLTTSEARASPVSRLSPTPQRVVEVVATGEYGYLLRASSCKRGPDHESWSRRVAASMLGDGLHSIVLKDLRVRHGLTYHADADVVEFSDASLVRVGFGVDPRRVEEASIALSALLQSAAENLSDEEIDSAARRLQSQERILMSDPLAACYAATRRWAIGLPVVEENVEVDCDLVRQVILNLSHPVESTTV